eukprot:gnl/TRDRNA2_/TRDRNA2_152960_c0_seq1.p1 gnl/TRDRNA2_/TRDRNA2_152960_c0~~gnl/TRDRNA2_/TRDRNA2_152960_c0_seq1.p1  ORF type:complete len:156 (-),score=36.05 gnl/TRDRNA2_/TRDRNA2_152960_c0_seq1:81-509(-)
MAFKDDLRHAEERFVVLGENEACEICGTLASRERFYFFACRHCFHEACLRAVILPTLSSTQKENLFALESQRLEHAAAAAGAGSRESPSMPLAEVEDQLDAILADDCPLCGKLMIQTVSRPFFDDGEGAEERSWAIGDDEDE